MTGSAAPSVPHKKKKFKKSWAQRFHIKVTWLREFMAEFVGTFILVLFGDASVAQVFLFDSFGGGPTGGFLAINFGWGIAVMLGILASGGVSGAHLNPAVTVSLVVVGKFKWKKMFHYIGAQYLGAFMAAFFVFMVYYDGFAQHHVINGWDLASAGVFATYPAPHVSWAGALFDQTLGTALLVFMILAVVDSKNMQVPLNLVPLYIGFIILNIGLCFGMNCGYAINPARDLGPRIFTAMAGWGGQVFTANGFFFIIPIIGPHVGAIIGAILYVFLIEYHWPDEDIPDKDYELWDKAGQIPPDIASSLASQLVSQMASQQASQQSKRPAPPKSQRGYVDLPGSLQNRGEEEKKPSLSKGHHVRSPEEPGSSEPIVDEFATEASPDEL